MVGIGPPDATPVRQTAPEGGRGSGQRIVHIDANVVDQVNRGNRDAAAALRRLIDDPKVSVRISPWAFRELVDQPDLPRTAAANRLMLSDLRIEQATMPNLAQRVDTGLLGQTRSGGNTVSIRDQQVIASARAEGAEIWSFDRTFRLNGAAVERSHGVRIAPETGAVGLVQGARQDYRVGRQLMALPEVEISFSGKVTRRGGGGGGSGAPPPAVPLGSPPITPSSDAGPKGRAPRLRAMPRLNLGMSRMWTRARSAGRGVGGAAGGAALALLGAYIQSRVDQRLIESDFEAKRDLIHSLIAARTAEILELYGEYPDQAIFANVAFRLEYHLLWEPVDRIEQQVYTGLTIDGVAIGFHPVDELGDMPLRRPGQLIEIVHIRGSASTPLPVAEMFTGEDLARARIAAIEQLVGRSSLMPSELQRLNEERTQLLEQLRTGR